MENPRCNSVAYVNGIPILLTPTRPGKKQKGQAVQTHCKG